MGLFGGFKVAAAVARQAAPPVDTDGRSNLATPWRDDDVLNRITFDELWGEIPEADLFAPVSRAQAMSVGPVARARNVVCTTGGRMPLRAYSAADPGTPAVVSEYDWLRQPESDPAYVRPGFVTYLWTIDALMFHGRAWWVITQRYQDTGRPRAFRWVPEWDARIANGKLVGLLSDDGVHFDEPNVVRIDGPHEGVLNYATRELNMALRLDRAAARASENPVPLVTLRETPGVAPQLRLSREEAEGVVARWRRRRREGETVAYLPASLEAKADGQNPEQLLIEGRKYSALQLCRAMNVPAWVADVPMEGSSLTYSNVASRSRELVDFALMPYLSAIESRLSMDDLMPRGWWCEFDMTALLRADFADRMDAYKTARESEVYTTDELRDMERLPSRIAEPSED